MERGQNDIKYWPGNLVIIIPTLFLSTVCWSLLIYQKKTNNLEQACVSMGSLSQFLRLLCQVPREERKWRLDARNNPKWTKSPIPSEPRAPRSGWHPNSLLGLATGRLWNPGPWVVKWCSCQGQREARKEEAPCQKGRSVNKLACLTPKTLNIILLPLLFIIFLLCYQLEVPSKGVTESKEQIIQLKMNVGSICQPQRTNLLKKLYNIPLQSRDATLSLGSVVHMPNTSVMHPLRGRIRETKFLYLSCWGIPPKISLH